MSKRAEEQGEKQEKLPLRIRIMDWLRQNGYVPASCWDGVEYTSENFIPKVIGVLLDDLSAKEITGLFGIKIIKPRQPRSFLGTIHVKDFACEGEMIFPADENHWTLNFFKVNAESARELAEKLVNAFGIEVELRECLVKGRTGLETVLR